MEKIPKKKLQKDYVKNMQVKKLKQEEVIDNTKIVELLKHLSGYLFHNVLSQETETHQDCLCSMARRIGHSE